MAPLIIAASLVPEDSRFYAELIAAADCVIAVDGGLAACRWADVSPDHLAGDLDSASADDVAWAEASGAVLHRLPTHKDETDLAAALSLAEELGYQTGTVTGVLGHRVDHELAALGALFEADPATWSIQEPDVNAWTLVAPASLALEGKGATVSVLGWTEGATITTMGMEYLVHDLALGPFDSRGVSNVITSDVASVVVESGAALVLSTRLDFPPAMGYATRQVDH
jgi:thiamine pyrophosphokinase